MVTPISHFSFINNSNVTTFGNLKANKMTDLNTTQTTNEAPVITLSTTEEPLLHVEQNLANENISLPQIVSNTVNNNDATATVTAAPQTDLVICVDDPIQNERVVNALNILGKKDNITLQEVSLAQVTLYNVISNYLVRKPANNANAFLQNLLAYIADNSTTTFSTTSIHRGISEIKSLNKNQIEEYKTYLSIFQNTALPITRFNNAKQINWTSIVAKLNPNFSESIVNRLKAFYKVN